LPVNRVKRYERWRCAGVVRFWKPKNASPALAAAIIKGTTAARTRGSSHGGGDECEYDRHHGQRGQFRQDRGEGGTAAVGCQDPCHDVAAEQKEECKP
jgi:hypothetical protein